MITPEEELNDILKNIRDELLRRSGIDINMVKRGEGNPIFDEIVNCMTMIRRGKEVLYGDYMKTHGGDPTNFALMEHFCDLKRKYVRANSLVKKRLEGQTFPLEEMLDTYMDMAVYAAMGVHLIWHLRQRDNASQPPDRRDTKPLNHNFMDTNSTTPLGPDPKGIPMTAAKYAAFLNKMEDEGKC